MQYFIEACLKTDLFIEWYNETFHLVETATGKKIVDVSFDMNFVGNELVVDVDGYKMKYTGSFKKDKDGFMSYEWKEKEKWFPFELRFKSCKL